MGSWGPKHKIISRKRQDVAERTVRGDCKILNYKESEKMSLDVHIYKTTEWVNTETGETKYLDDYSAEFNFTTNVVPMWKKAGVYEALHGGSTQEVAVILRNGIKHMKEHAEEYKLLNPKNGWGDYESNLEFLEKLADYCEKHSDGKVRGY